MSPTRENSQTQSFIYEIFKIVIEILNSAGTKNQEINNLPRTDQNQSVDSLLKELSSKIQADPATIAMIYGNRNDYQSRIRQALENDQEVIDSENFYKKSQPNS